MHNSPTRSPSQVPTEASSKKKENFKVDKYTVVLRDKNQHSEKGNVASSKVISQKKFWLANKESQCLYYKLWSGGIFNLVGAGFECCDLHFTAHLITPHSMLPFSTLNAAGHSKIVKLGVENGAWLLTVPSVLVFQNLLLLTVFSLKHWRAWPAASSKSLLGY